MRTQRFCNSWLAVTGAIVVAAVAQTSARAQGQFNGNDFGGPVYQRHASDWKSKHGFDHRFRKRDDKFMSPQVNSGWFQRPYPYHLDYYKMRYGGSYAPYFGNLYGPPQVVTAPPYYGPYYGEFVGPNGGGFNGGFPAYQNGVMLEAPMRMEYAAPQNPAVTPPNGDTLPTP